jgi:hypothetical protein
MPTKQTTPEKLMSTTKDIDFIMLDYSRDEKSISHARKIAKSMKRLGQNWIPIMISKDGIVMDGQHRYMAYKMLKEEGDNNVRLLYIISSLRYDESRAEVQDVISTVNTESKNWRMADWVAFHAHEKEDYRQLLELRELYPKFHLSALASISVLSSGGGSLTSTIRDGKFKYSMNKQKEYILDETERLANIYPESFTQKAFLCSIIEMNRQPQFKPKRMFAKINENLGSFQKQSGQQNWTGYLTAMYNKHMRNKEDMVKAKRNSY